MAHVQAVLGALHGVGSTQMMAPAPQAMARGDGDDEELAPLPTIRVPPFELRNLLAAEGGAELVTARSSRGAHVALPSRVGDGIPASARFSTVSERLCGCLCFCLAQM